MKESIFTSATKEQKISQFINMYQKIYSNDITLGKGVQDFNVGFKEKIN